VKGKTQLLPEAGPEVVVQVGATVVVVVVVVVVVAGVVVVVVVVVVVPHTLVVHTSWRELLQIQVLQSTVLRAPTTLQLDGGATVVVVVVVVVVALDSTWQEELEVVSQSPQLLVTTLPLPSTERAHQGRVESAKVHWV